MKTFVIYGIRIAAHVSPSLADIVFSFFLPAMLGGLLGTVVTVQQVTVGWGYSLLCHIKAKRSATTKYPISCWYWFGLIS